MKNHWLLAFILFCLSAALPSAAAEACDQSWNPPKTCFGINWETATVLVVADIDVDARTETVGYSSPGDDESPLHWAAKWNKNPDVIALLINNGADVNARNERGETPLHWAAEFNENPNIVALLISKGARVNVTTDYSRTPLNKAKTPEIISILVKNGAKSESQFSFWERLLSKL